MGSKTSKAERPAPVKTKATVIPRLPQEIIDVILDHLAANSDFKSLIGLRSCALVSKPWVPSCRRHLFHTILFTPKATARWIKVFPVPEESPAHHVRDLRFSTRGRIYHCTQKPFEYFPWFTNVEKVTWSGLEGFPPLWIPSLGRLPQSVTSLTIKADTVPLAQTRDILIQLPNLDDLSLSGFLETAEGDALPGMGTVLRGRFGGQLRLLDGQADEDVVNMLLEVPTGLHFTELHIRGTHESFLPTVRLAEACCKTLVKLSYTVSIHGRSEAFERSFDFSKYPNLQEVDLGIGWMAGGLLWIPAALSTLKRATSPHLSALQLSFIASSVATRSVGNSIEDMGNDLRRAAGEVARIESEFEGAVELTVFRGPGFKAVFDRLNILKH